MPQTNISVPNILGKNINQALDILSQKHLSLTIIKKETSPAKEPIVLLQNPIAGTNIKKNSTVYIISSQPTKEPTMPNLIGLSHSLCEQQLSHTPFSNIQVPLISKTNNHNRVCIAHIPHAGQPIGKNVLLYTTAAEELFLVPNLIGKTFYEAEDFFKKHNLLYEVNELGNKNHHTLLDTAHIVDQQPAAHTFFVFRKPPTFQITILY